MAEKRFFMSGYAIWDSQNDNRRVSSETACKLLNELHEEKEQLKKENQMLKHTIGRNENYIARLTHKGEWKDTTKPLYRSISRGD